MEANEAILIRRSVRHYQDRPVARELIEKIVQAGLAAPSGRNVQPVEFIAVTDSERRKKLAALCDYGKFIDQAPVCLVVISRATKYFLEDGSAAAENCLIAATGLGLGSCWIAGDKKPYAGTILQLLAVPEDYQLICLITIGYPVLPIMPVRKKSLKDGLHWESYHNLEQK